MSFFQDDDEGIMRITMMAIIGAIIITSIVGFLNHLGDLHDEKMASMGCTETIVCSNGQKHWECNNGKHEEK